MQVYRGFPEGPRTFHLYPKATQLYSPSACTAYIVPGPWQENDFRSATDRGPTYSGALGTILSLPRVLDGCSSGNLDEMGLDFRLGKLNYPAPALTTVPSAVILRSTRWRRGLFLRRGSWHCVNEDCFGVILNVVASATFPMPTIVVLLTGEPVPRSMLLASFPSERIWQFVQTSASIVARLSG